MKLITALSPQEADLIEIQRVGRAAWEATYRGRIISDAQFEYMFDHMYSLSALSQQMTVSQHTFFGAFQGDSLQGFMSVGWPDPTQEFAKVHKLYVHPDVQGQGIGRALLLQLEALCQARYIHEIRLNVNRYNPAQHFYKKMGYAVLYEEDIDIGRGYLMEDFVMGKKC